MAEAEVVEGAEAPQISPENEKLLNDTKEKFFNLLEPKLVSQLRAIMDKRDIRVENVILGQGVYGIAYPATRPNKKKNDKNRFLRDSFGRRLREQIVVKWTSGEQYLRKKSKDEDKGYLIRELYLSTLVTHAYLVTTYFRFGPVVPDHGMVVLEKGKKSGFDEEMKPTGGFYMFQEFLHGGTMYNYLNNIRRHTAPAKLVKMCVPMAQCWSRQLLAAVYYLHANGIVHRDMHFNNIMLDRHGNLRIIDFGKAHQHHSEADPPEGEQEKEVNWKAKVGLGVPKKVSEKVEPAIYFRDMWRVSQLIYIFFGKKTEKEAIMAKTEDLTVQEDFLKRMAVWEDDPNAKPADMIQFLGHAWLTSEDPTYLYLYGSSYGAF